MFIISDDDVLYIAEFAAVSPFQSCILGWDVLKMGYSPRVANAMAAGKVFRIKEAFKVKIICDTSLEICNVVPTVKPSLNVFVFRPVLDDLTVREVGPAQVCPWP